MKTTSLSSLLLFLLIASTYPSPLQAEEKHPSGPNGGRILPGNPRSEFWITPERKIQILFLDEKLQPTPRIQQSAIAHLLLTNGRQSLDFEPHGDNALISTKTLPEGDGYVIVIQLRASPESKPENHRISYHEHVCSGCNLLEYACTCHH